METNYKEYYHAQLDEAHEFQDYCTEWLLKELGIAITNYQSKKYQYNSGENPQGLEIKLDKRYKETGNLYIETAEKSNPQNQNYIKSGIYRLDNSWLYAIGDYDCIWIFAKKLLVGMDEIKKYKEVRTATSIGFLLSLKEADKYCAKRLLLVDKGVS